MDLNLIEEKIKKRRLSELDSAVFVYGNDSIVDKLSNRLNASKFVFDNMNKFEKEMDLIKSNDVVYIKFNVNNVTSRMFFNFLRRNRHMLLVYIFDNEDNIKDICYDIIKNKRVN